VIALLDASVLYPAPLRDLLMHLAQTMLFNARWSNLIHDEWTRNVLEALKHCSRMVKFSSGLKVD
jgi:hypothetical protein